jgi:hypothetical protein
MIMKYIWLQMADERASSFEVEKSKSSDELGLESSNNDDVRGVFGHFFLYFVYLKFQSDKFCFMFYYLVC